MAPARYALSVAQKEASPPISAGTATSSWVPVAAPAAIVSSPDCSWEIGLVHSRGGAVLAMYHAAKTGMIPSVCTDKLTCACLRCSVLP